MADALGQIIAGLGLINRWRGSLPLSFAAISGSGMASTQSLYGFFYGPAIALDLDPVDVGAMVSLGSAAGRTMSPVAAVTLMCATLSGTNPFTLAKQVAVPLLGQEWSSSRGVCEWPVRLAAGVVHSGSERTTQGISLRGVAALFRVFGLLADETSQAIA
ncbi:MAG: hypothetical protein U0792_21610 [Gemmataceae bacterium]